MSRKTKIPPGYERSVCSVLLNSKKIDGITVARNCERPAYIVDLEIDDCGEKKKIIQFALCDVHIKKVNAAII